MSLGYKATLEIRFEVKILFYMSVNAFMRANVFTM